MFENYLKIAFRAMAKNKLYAAINILGLATGLCVFFFALILANYEQMFDQNVSVANFEQHFECALISFWSFLIQIIELALISFW